MVQSCFDIFGTPSATDALDFPHRRTRARTAEVRK
jgi:hypothetical protein